MELESVGIQTAYLAFAIPVVSLLWTGVLILGKDYRQRVSWHVRFFWGMELGLDLGLITSTIVQLRSLDPNAARFSFPQLIQTLAICGVWWIGRHLEEKERT